MSQSQQISAHPTFATEERPIYHPVTGEFEEKPWEQMSDSERLAELRAHSQPRPLDWHKFRQVIREKAKRSQAQQAERDSGNVARST